MDVAKLEIQDIGQFVVIFIYKTKHLRYSWEKRKGRGEFH